MAAQRMADATDLWASGVTVSDVLGDDGLIDPAKLDAAITELLDRKAHLGRGGPITRRSRRLHRRGGHRLQIVRRRRDHPCSEG